MDSPKAMTIVGKHITALEMASSDPRPALILVKSMNQCPHGGKSDRHPSSSRSTAGSLLAGSQNSS